MSRKVVLACDDHSGLACWQSVSSAVVLLFYSSVSLSWLNHCPSYFFMIAEPYQSFDENIFLTLNTDLAENLVNRKILRILNIQVSMRSNHNTKEVRFFYFRISSFFIIFISLFFILFFISLFFIFIFLFFISSFFVDGDARNRTF